MKKLISIVLIIVLMFSFVGCMTAEESETIKDIVKVIEYYKEEFKWSGTAFYENIHGKIEGLEDGDELEYVYDKKDIKFFDKEHNELFGKDIENYYGVIWIERYEHDGIVAFTMEIGSKKHYIDDEISENRLE